jgi:lipoprotein
MKNIAYLIVLFIIISCKKDSDRIEIDNIDGYKVEKKFKNDTLVSSKTYDGDMLIWEMLYNKNGITEKATEFYPTGSIKSVSTLQKEPNHYYDIEYYESGEKQMMGESDFIKSRQSRLRRGAAIFYTKQQKISSILVFFNDGKEKEYLVRETILDTITDKILTDREYDPPALLK